MSSLLLICAMSLAVFAATASYTTPAISDLDQIIIDDPPPGTTHCYRCSGDNGCEYKQVYLCEWDSNECGTIARSPNFVSQLACVEGNSKICSLIYTQAENVLKFVCFCKGETCNTMFSERIRKNLIKFFSNFPKYMNLVNGSDFTDLFFTTIGKQIPVAYSEMTEETWPNDVVDEDAEQIGESSVASLRHFYVRDPHAEALRQYATAPTSDDEDDVEGSGMSAGAGVGFGAGLGVGTRVRSGSSAGAGTEAEEGARATSTVGPDVDEYGEVATLETSSILPTTDSDAASSKLHPTTLTSLALTTALLLL